MSIDVVFLNILHVNYLWWSNFWKPLFFVCCCCFFMFPTCHVCINLRNSPRGVPRTPNRLMHDAYVRKFDAFLKVIYFGNNRLFGLYMDVSENSEFSPQIIHFNRVFHYFHHPFWGTPVVGKSIGDEILPSYMRSLLQSLKINQDFTVYPPWNEASEVTPENGWLEYVVVSFWVRLCLFSGANC